MTSNRLKKMERRNRRGGRSLQQTLRLLVESCKSRYSTAEEIVYHLRSTYPDYHRTKHQILLRFVRDALHSTANTPTPTPARNHNENNNVDDDDGRSASRKRQRRKSIDEAEERLQNMIAMNKKRRRRRLSMPVPSTSTTDSASASESADDDDGAVSEDAVYREKVEPASDLLNSMLRNSYRGTKAVPVAEEKNVELETTGNSSKATITVNVDGCEAKSSATPRKQLKGSHVGVKGKGGPRFKDLGGMKEVLEELMLKALLPLCRPQLKKRPVTGILLHGPPGCGKTRLAHAIANETGLPFYPISATEVVSGVSGASEENIRDHFSKAKMNAPSIVFIDEIDAIASKRENLQREMEKRIVTQLMTCMDQSDGLLQPADDSLSSDEPRRFVLVIGATNRPDDVDRALRRPGRLELEFFIGLPDEFVREEILSVLTHNEGLFDLRKIARSTPGFAGADLEALVNEAHNLALKRIIDERKRELSQTLMSEHAEYWLREHWSTEETNELAIKMSDIKMSDFEKAVEVVQPSSRREGFSSIPNVKWEDVGGYDCLRQEFEHYIIRRIKFPEDFEEFGIDLEMGYLLYGPPGCGKTLIAKAVAKEAGANFIHIKGPELLNKYVGESELEVRKTFSRARTCAPCILFFDEVDALATERGKEGGAVTERVLNQLLIELDGAEQRRGVFVIGATNRPEVIDRALLRPGRFGKHLHVSLPGPDDRGLILKALARKKKIPIDASVDLSAIGRMKACENLCGADLAELLNEAATAALKEKGPSTETARDTSTVKPRHFEEPLSKASSSVSEMQTQHYQRWSASFKPT